MVECSQFVHDFFRVVVNISNFIIYVMSTADSNQLCDFLLHQSHVMTAPAEPVGHIGYILIILILLIEQLCFQELTRGDQSETVDIQRRIPHTPVRGGTKDIHTFAGLRQNTPFWLFFALGVLIRNHKRIRVRIAFSTHRAA